MPVGILASAGIGLASNLVSQFFGNNAARKQAEEQNELNMKNWYLQQEYNSPVNQMKRYTEAGLNPQLIYGQGTPGNAPAPPQQEAKPRFAPKIDVLQQYQSAVQIQQLQQTVENLKSNQQLIQANEELRQQQAELTQKQSDWYDYLSSSKAAMIGSNIDLNKVKEGQGWAAIDKMDSEIGLNKQKIAYMGLENERQQSLNAARIKLMSAQTAETNQRRLKEIVETEMKRNQSPYQGALLRGILNKNEAATEALLQGRATSKAQETLMLTNAALQQYKVDGYVGDKFLQILMGVAKTVK